MAYRTLGELRAELSRRLGFGAQGSAGINSGLLDSFLQNAQAQVWAQFEWRHLIKYDEITTGVGQTIYDWADDCDQTRIREIAILDAVWMPMREGITFAMRSTADSRTIPASYERFAQMEVWPEPDAAYTIRRYYVAKCGRFTQDNDRASLDDALIFLHALTNAKLHYRQQDGQVYANQLNAMMTALKAQNRGNPVVSRGGDAAPMVRPRDV